VLGSRTSVKMSRASVELLFGFLQRAQLWPLLGLVNERVELEAKDTVQTDIRPLEGLQVRAASVVGWILIRV